MGPAPQNSDICTLPLTLRAVAVMVAMPWTPGGAVKVKLDAPLVVVIEAGVTIPGFAESVTTVPLGAAAPLATTFTATWVDVPQLRARLDGFSVTEVGPGVGVTVG